MHRFTLNIIEFIDIDSRHLEKPPLQRTGSDTSLRLVSPTLAHGGGSNINNSRHPIDPKYLTHEQALALLHDKR